MIQPADIDLVISYSCFPERRFPLIVCDFPLTQIQTGQQRRTTGDLEWLKESISEIGLMSPIWITPGGVLIAGWHRLHACRELGHTQIRAQIVDTDGLKLAIASIDENLVRKDLSALERAEHLAERKDIFEALHPDARRGGDRGNQHTGGKKRQTATSAFCQQASVWSGHSRRSVSSYVRVAREITPQAKERLRGSTIEDSITLLAALSRVPSLLQARTVDAYVTTRCRTIREAFELVDRDINIESQVGRHLPSSIQLLNADFRHVGGAVPDASVSLIVTDPPYDKDHLHLFEALGEFAAMKLADGGSMFCMIGAYHLPKIIADLSKNLTWQWCYAFLLDGPGAVIFSRRICTAHKLILWFVKGEYTGPPFTDVIDGVGKDKRFHPWGQSVNGFDRLIERYSKPGDLVLDPFLGGGTTGVAAASLQRRFIGIEINPKHFKTARDRLASLPTD
jgi:16S rRNA G966 N2-methylase RsmD